MQKRQVSDFCIKHQDIVVTNIIRKIESFICLLQFINFLSLCSEMIQPIQPTVNLFQDSFYNLNIPTGKSGLSNNAERQF